MITKELRKFKTHEWIFFILIVLCFINVFIDVSERESVYSVWNEYESVYQEKIDNYTKYINDISKNAGRISSFSLFSKESNYQKKSAEKTVKAYEPLKHIKPEKGNYIAIDQMTKIGFTDVIILIIIFQYAIVLILYDRNNGMIKLLKSCKNGRMKLGLSKIGALLVMSFTIVTIVSLVRLISLALIYGCDSFFVPIQSVPDFYESPLKLNILGYLLLYISMKAFAIFLCGMIVLAICSKTSNYPIIYVLSGITAAIAIGINQKFAWNHKLAFIKLISPATLINVKSITIKQYNINILEEPVNVFMVISFIIFVISILCGIQIVFSFRKKNNL